MKQVKPDKNLDLVEFKFLNFDNAKSVILTKLESRTSKRRVHITY